MGNRDDWVGRLAEYSGYKIGLRIRNGAHLVLESGSSLKELKTV